MANNSVDMDQLSEHQEVALQQYISVTDQGVQAAIPLLHRSQWNVQIAIAKFFDGEGPDPVAEALSAQNLHPPRNSRQENLQHSLLHEANLQRSIHPDAAPRIVPQSEDQTVHRPPYLLSLLFIPFTLFYKLLTSSIGIFSYLFPLLPSILQPNNSSGNRNRNTNFRRALKPRDAASRLKREFDEEYGPNNVPLFEDGYAQALDLAKRELKNLLVILISPEHDDTSSFIRSTLLSSSVTDFLNKPQNNLLIWAGDVRDPETYQVSIALRCTKFPFSAVLTHTATHGVAAMSVIARMAGPMPANTYISKLQLAIEAHAEALNTIRAARSAQRFERSLREEQDDAYERSLAQDRERARRKKQVEEVARKEENKRWEEASNAHKLAQVKVQWRRWRAKGFPSEPAENERDVVRVRIVMPERGRILRRFGAQQSIEELYAFVDCYEFLDDPEKLDDAEQPETYQHEYDFRIVSTLPRIVYNIEAGGTIGERVGRSGNLIVEGIKDDDDDE